MSPNSQHIASYQPLTKEDAARLLRQAEEGASRGEGAAHEGLSWELSHRLMALERKCLGLVGAALAEKVASVTGLVRFLEDCTKMLPSRFDTAGDP